MNVVAVMHCSQAALLQLGKQVGRHTESITEMKGSLSFTLRTHRVSLVVLWRSRTIFCTNANISDRFKRPPCGIQR